MSGGGIDRAHMKDAERLIEGYYDKTLRSAADRIENGCYATQELTENEQAQLAALFRAKADRIEMARESVRTAFDSRGLERLLKAVDYSMTMDYGPEKVAEAFDAFGIDGDDGSERTDEAYNDFGMEETDE